MGVEIIRLINPTYERYWKNIYGKRDTVLIAWAERIFWSIDWVMKCLSCRELGAFEVNEWKRKGFSKEMGERRVVPHGRANW